MEHKHHSSRRLQSQRGGTAILFAIVLPVLLGFAALAVDLARIHLVKVELQNAADAASLGGARSLSDPGGQPYNWSAASIKALDVARSNVANGGQIQDAAIETGYWNILNPALGMRPAGTPGVPATGDVPAVRVTTAISATQNNGPLQLLFAPILGITERSIQASAIAVIAPPSGGTGMFPFVIATPMLDHYWDRDTNSPVLENGVAPTIKLGSIYHFEDSDDGVLSGEWTTFQTEDGNPSGRFLWDLLKDLTTNGNDTALYIGDNTYIQPGTKAHGFDFVPEDKDVGIFVVDNIKANSSQPIVAIAAFHIDHAGKQGRDGKYISGHFVNTALIPGTTPGTGNGIAYGAYTPPILVK
ncbi:pilus assembly protein TadG-related protein [Pelodictyon luteolum]|uniref:Putative membrane protein n=1 Tax=Chlorobium luteolum (strain DSM 273 / BCRC 81028 / 2530) TaxID=319225 RepID=Q3B546_CHLL3|nr:pilus assembly protein TadG-related protein [Pelodictyon luteolum]ABB23535.1 putative membrane protein [Pelodictyon luteolum DSM 273]